MVRINTVAKLRLGANQRLHYGGFGATSRLQHNGKLKQLDAFYDSILVQRHISNTDIQSRMSCPTNLTTDSYVK